MNLKKYLKTQKKIKIKIFIFSKILLLSSILLLEINQIEKLIFNIII